MLAEQVVDDRTTVQAGLGWASLATCPTALRRIRHPGIALAVWQRRLADDIAAELGKLALDDLDDILFTSDADALETVLADALEGAGYSGMPALRQDIFMLARQHAVIAGRGNVRIRLEVVETDACRKFHADYVEVRTITTYVGQGTQWIEAPSADRAGLPDGPDIRCIDAGAVAMFKGRLWQESPAILHRSPPIGGSGAQRLVLAIDSVAGEMPC